MATIGKRGRGRGFRAKAAGYVAKAKQGALPGRVAKLVSAGKARGNKAVTVTAPNAHSKVGTVNPAGIIRGSGGTRAPGTSGTSPNLDIRPRREGGPTQGAPTPVRSTKPSAALRSVPSGMGDSVFSASSMRKGKSSTSFRAKAAGYVARSR